MNSNRVLCNNSLTGNRWKMSIMNIGGGVFNKFNSNFNKNMLRSSRFYSTKDNSTNDDVIDINSTFGTDIPDVNIDEVNNSKEKIEFNKTKFGKSNPTTKNKKT